MVETVVRGHLCILVGEFPGLPSYRVSVPVEREREHTRARSCRCAYRDSHLEGRQCVFVCHWLSEAPTRGCGIVQTMKVLQRRPSMVPVATDEQAVATTVRRCVIVYPGRIHAVSRVTPCVCSQPLSTTRALPGRCTRSSALSCWA